jgi:hypothetical protein
MAMALSESETTNRLNSVKNFYNHFIFKTSDELRQEFFNNWTLINREIVSFIQKSNSNFSNSKIFEQLK